MKKVLLFLPLLLTGIFAFGQEPLMSVSKIDSLPELIQYYLQETTSKHFEDPKVPRFLMKDRTDNFVFGVGGGVEAKMFYDNQGNRGISFAMDKIDSESRFDNDIIDLTLFSTNLVFKVLGKTKAGVVDALISVDFGNDNGGIRLMQAYVDVFGLRIGKANSAFCDDVSLDLVDGNANVVNTGRKMPQISYSYRFNNGMRVQAGVEFPQSTSIWIKDGNSGIRYMACDILMPDLTANLYYSGENIHLYTGVNGRLMNYIDVEQRLRNVPGYAFQAGMNWSFVKRPEQTHKLFLQGIWAHGMADCCSSMREKGLSAVVDMNSDTYVIPNIAGGYLGYQVTFGDNSFNFAVSANTAMGHEMENIGEMYKWACSGVLNYIRTFLKYGTTGAEIIVGRRTDLNLETRSNLRAYLFMKYNF